MVLTGDLRRKDFSDQDLARVHFRDADLYQASFAGSNLEAAVFENCFAAEATFQKANCAGLCALHTNFYRASFAGANLRNALLRNCVLAGADLRAADLRRVSLTLDCNSFEELQIDCATSAELAYLFGRARSPHRQRWLDVVGDRHLPRLEHIFAR